MHDTYYVSIPYINETDIFKTHSSMYVFDGSFFKNGTGTCSTYLLNQFIVRISLIDGGGVFIYNIKNFPWKFRSNEWMFLLCPFCLSWWWPVVAKLSKSTVGCHSAVVRDFNFVLLHLVVVVRVIGCKPVSTYIHIWHRAPASRESSSMSFLHWNFF